MGRVHNALNRSILGRAITAALGVKQPEPGLERFGETMQPTIDLWARPEWDFLRDERRAQKRNFSPAVGAMNSGAGLVNPANSNCLVVVKRVSLIVGAPQTVSVELCTAAQVVTFAGAGLNTGYSVDRRWPAAPGPSWIATPKSTIHAGAIAATTAGGDLIDTLSPGATTTIELFPVAFPLVVPPGHGFIAIGQTVNISVVLNILWTERTILSGELG